MALIKCPECGQSVSNKAKACLHCGYPIAESPEAYQPISSGDTVQKKEFFKKSIPDMKAIISQKPYIIKGLVGLLAVIAVIVIVVLSRQCEASDCTNRKVQGGSYCATHTCGEDDCFDYKRSGEVYCWLHDTSDDYSYASYETESSAMSFSEIEIEHNSSYTTCTGKVTNTGTKTYSFVEIKGAFKDSSGNVLDTDWTYAVGSEGLAPGESTSFYMSVDKDTRICKCSISIID